MIASILDDRYLSSCAIAFAENDAGMRTYLGACDSARRIRIAKSEKAGERQWRSNETTRRGMAPW